MGLVIILYSIMDPMYLNKVLWLLENLVNVQYFIINHNANRHYFSKQIFHILTLATVWSLISCFTAKTLTRFDITSLILTV